MSFESKYVGPATLAPLLAARLRNSLAADPHHGRDRVHSVYFDTPDRRALQEVESGDRDKVKVRIRWYESTGPEAAWLECKRKHGARRSKVRVPVDDVDPDLPLHHPRWQQLLARLTAHDPTPTATLSPCLHLAYRRRRYVHRPSGLRVALDDDLRLHAAHHRFARTSPPRSAPHENLVLELKGDSRQLPQALGFVRELGLRRRAFSKFGAMCGAE